MGAGGAASEAEVDGAIFLQALHSSAKSLLMQANPGQSRPCYGRGAACQVFLTRRDRMKAENRADE